MSNNKAQVKLAEDKLRYLCGLGIDTSVLKKFKSSGVVTVFESVRSEWQNKLILNNPSSSGLGYIPRAYSFLDTHTGISDEMIEKKREIEGKGYLVYAILRTTTPDNDTLDYLVVPGQLHNPQLTEMLYEADLESFKTKGITECFSYKINSDESIKYKSAKDITVKVRYEHLVRKDLICQTKKKS